VKHWRILSGMVSRDLRWATSGALGGAVLLLHHGYDVYTRNQHHPVNRICQWEGIRWADGVDQGVKQSA
jgi:hypothetical protein